MRLVSLPPPQANFASRIRETFRSIFSAPFAGASALPATHLEPASRRYAFLAAAQQQALAAVGWVDDIEKATTQPLTPLTTRRKVIRERMAFRGTAPGLGHSRGVFPWRRLLPITPSFRMLASETAAAATNRTRSHPAPRRSVCSGYGSDNR